MAADDDSFGPRLPGYFDFTLLFEQSIFSLLPMCAFLIAAPCRIAQLCRRKVCVESRKLLPAKLVRHP